MKSQGVSLKVLVLLFAALIASSCDEPQSEGRGSIGDNRAGSKFLLKVPRSDDKVFLVNMNTFGSALGYDTVSLQVYSVADEENLNRPEFSVEIPNFAKSAVVNEKYIFLTYDALEDDPARVFVFPYNLDGDGSLTLEPAQIFNLESSNKADAKLKARYSAVNEVTLWFLAKREKSS